MTMEHLNLLKMQERLVQMQKPIKLEKQILVLKKGETKNLILYCIFTDEEVENDIIALNFHLRNSPFIGPLAIIHEPETN